ncbi:putative tubulin-tyrsoine ligase-like protein, partial [Trypanosoma cruzi]
MMALRAKRVSKFFILKPNSGCQGRGIVISRDPLNAVEDLDNYIVQEYVTRPLLLEGRKFDLRVYVLLTSIRAPSIFMFKDGLVRLCAELYEKPTDSNARN